MNHRILTTIALCLVAGPALADGTRVLDEHGRAPNVLTHQATTDESPGLRGAPLPADWQVLGPFGGDVGDVAVSPVDPAVVLAGLAPPSGGGGLFRSTDGGATWNEIATLTGTPVYDIEFTPAGVAYIGTQDGPWKSTDDGVSWADLDLGIGLNQQVLEITLDPIDPDIVWAGVGDALGGNANNVMVSFDAGASWNDRTPPLPTPLGGAGIAIDPSAPNRMFAAFAGGFGGGSVWFSDDAGLSWVNRSGGLPGNPLNDVEFDGNRVLLTGGQLFGGQDVGLFSSDNDGVTWTALHDGSWPQLVFNDIEIDPNNEDIILLAAEGTGVYRSVDDGATWAFSLGGTGGLSTRDIAFAPGDSDVIFLGNASVAVWKSIDGGDTFAQSSAGIGALDVFGVDANPNDPLDRALAFQGQNNGGVYTSTDGGVTWELADLPGTRYNTVKYDFDGTLYAVSDGPTTIAPEGLYRRNPDGTWDSIGPDQGGVFESELFPVVFDPDRPDVIWTAGSDFGVAGFEPTVWLTDDNGATWTKVYEGAETGEDVLDLAIVDADTVLGGFIDFADEQEGGVIRSDDYGTTWSPSSNGLDLEAQIYDLEIAANLVYAADDDAGNGGLFVSNDAGLTWTNTGFAQRALNVQVDPTDLDNIFVLQRSSPFVLYSDDGGATFVNYNDGLDNPGFMRAFTLIEAGCPELFAASSTGTWATPIHGLPGDIDGDGDVDQADLGELLAAYGSSDGDPNWNPDADLDGDGMVGQADLGILLADFGQSC
jgi:photosystem II stability/assembly factor-like uncharacterized protein